MARVKEGLIMKLHGVPGVGKTSTSECVAALLGQPLFPITCSDLGTTAAEVEQSLNSIFEKAANWNCVLLLNEADMFLAQRTRGCMKYACKKPKKKPKRAQKGTSLQ
jgi:SpoVK/Ycf46/Vps4 family AAA+-type ATPase